MTKLLHIGASPRGGASESLAIATTFLDAYRSAHPDHDVETWDLWDGTLPAFGPPAAGAKMTVFGVDPQSGYEGLLAGRGKRVAVIYTSAVWGPSLGPAFGRDFHSVYFEDWLRWTGIDDIVAIRMHPTLTGDADAHREAAHGQARRVALTFGTRGVRRAA